MNVTEVDKRYRIAVLLHRSDRPDVVKWHCPFCKSFVIELVNQEVISASDTMDFENMENLGIGVRCSGHCLKDGRRVWWYFMLGEAK